MDNLSNSVDDILTNELVPLPASLDSEQSVDSETTRLTDSVVAEFSESVPISTSLEAEQVDYSATDNLTASVDTELSELVPLSTSLEPEEIDYSATDNLTDDVNDGIISELVPVPNSLDSEQSVNKETTHPTDSVDAEFSESVPLSTSLEAEQVDYSETGNLTSDVDTKLNASVPISTYLESEQLDYSATDNLTGGVDTDLSESAQVSTSLGSELHAYDDITSLHVVDDSVDSSEMEKSALLDELVPSSDLENKIDVGNTERITRPELFLVSGAACLPHPSEALTNREDAYIISPQNWLVVADGVGQWSLEGSNTRVYIRELMGKCEDIVSTYENISTIKPADVLIKSAAETHSPGSSSVLVAYFDGQALHAANVGNTGFIIIRDGSVFKISNAMFHELSFPIHLVKGDDHSEVIEEYKIDLNNGDVIVFGTNGLFDNLYEHEIASTISKSLQASLEPQEIAEILATAAQEVGRSRSSGSPFADAAQALGYVSYAGGKLDDVTVIVSLVQTT
ncbi:hypothetical protein KIW84_015745 [Lathyrus oleraceus]|nr:hypothetical protein KIW84_015745 [Pisum sativum]